VGGVAEEVTAPRRSHEGRRRQVNIEGGREHRHAVKVSAEEEARLRTLAAEHRVSVPRLLVESALAQRGETPTERRDAMAALFGLHRLMAGVANNLNQLTRATHATGDLPPQTEDVIAAVRRIAYRIDEAIDRLARP
jgi:hypothetical protein